MEKLTVFKVTDLLRAEGIPDSLLTVLAGMWHKWIYTVYTYMYMCDNYMLLQRIILMALHWLLYLKILKNSGI